MARKSKRLLAVWYSRTHQDTAAVRADGLWVKCCILVFEHNTADVPMVVIGCLVAAPLVAHNYQHLCYGVPKDWAKCSTAAL